MEEHVGADVMEDASARKTVNADAVVAPGRGMKILTQRKNHNLNSLLEFPERILDIASFSRPDFLIFSSSSSWSE